MKRDPNLIPLSHDHRRALFLAQNLKANGPKFKGYPTEPEEKGKFAQEFWANDLNQHIDLEEQIVFPFLKAKDVELAQIIEELIEEHKTLRNSFQILSLQDEELIHTLDQLGHLLERHIRKEERIFFQRVQELVAQPELEELGAKIKSFKKDHER